MPRRPVAPKIRKTCGLSPDQTEHLIRGSNLLKPTTPDPVFANEEERRKAWFENRDFLMSFMGKKPSLSVPGFPHGTRPDGWWSYEAPEPRRRLEGTAKQVGEKMYFGKPAVIRLEDGHDWEEEVYETQTEYLDRLNLLTKEERDVLAQGS